LTELQQTVTVRHGRAHYEIRINGHLDERWSSWFDCMNITLEDNGTTLLTGLVDQAALHRSLRTIRDMGTPLLSVIYLQSEQEETLRSKQ
jgi:hypothetical protein